MKKQNRRSILNNYGSSNVYIPNSFEPYTETPWNNEKELAQTSYKKRGTNQK